MLQTYKWAILILCLGYEEEVAKNSQLPDVVCAITGKEILWYNFVFF